MSDYAGAMSSIQTTMKSIDKIYKDRVQRISKIPN